MGRTSKTYNGKPVFKAKNGAFYVKMANGKPKFIPKSSVTKKRKTTSKSRRSKSKSSRKGRKMGKKRPVSISSVAALAGPMLIAADRAMDEGGSAAQKFKRGAAEYVSMYAGYNFEDNEFQPGNLGIGYGFLAASKAVKAVKRANGNPTIPGGIVTF